MLVMDLLIPAAMLGFGYLFQKRPPDRINSLFGYRTARSMKNKATWDFAHRYAGRVWVRCGWIGTAITLFAMLPLIERDTETVGLWGGILCGMLCLLLIVVIPLTEHALKKNFDRFGRKRTQT